MPSRHSTRTRVAVVCRREDSDDLAVPQHLIPRGLHHVGPHDGFQALARQPLTRHVQAKDVTDAARVAAPAADVWGGVGPQQVRRQALAIGVDVLSRGEKVGVGYQAVWVGFICSFV